MAHREWDPSGRARVCALAGLLAWLGAGCSGSIEGGRPGDNGPVAGAGAAASGAGSGAANGAGSGAGSGAGASGAGGGGAGTVGSDPADPRIAQRIVRLSPAQLDGEIERLFGPGAPSLNLPETASESGIVNIAANAVIDTGNASLFVDGTRAVANWVSDGRAARTRCASYGDGACVDTLLGWLPREAFRRPVSTDEVSALRTLFDQLHASYPYDYALSGVVRAVLLSPEFLYRTELSTVLGPYEIANALAFAITDEAPDAELIESAENEDLANPDVREAQARRLMDRSERVWQRFFWEWLHLGTLYSQGAEVGLSDLLVDQMEEEYRAFIREVVVVGRGTLKEVMSAPYTFVQPELATHYGVDHPGTGLQRVELDSEQRGGILTQGAWLVSHGKRGRDNVVRRGMNIYKEAMCNNDLKPPAGLDVVAELAKLVSADASVREVVDTRGSATGCGGCHRVPDPIGMVFETFTSDGRFQDVYPDGQPVDSNVSIAGIGDFDNARLLAEAFADNEIIARCFIQRFAHFLVGVDLGSPRMVAWSGEAQQRLLATEGSLEEMLVALVRHPAFIERRTEVAP